MFERISVNPMIMGGKPCVRGTRIAVYMVLELLEIGLTFDEIIYDYYPQLKKEDIAACMVCGGFNNGKRDNEKL